MKGDTNTICECYHNLPNNEGECWGTRERERCYCNGDERYCSYYLEKRNSAIDAERKDKNMSREKTTLNTAEMWLKAQEDGEIYECVNGDIAYSKAMGLVDKDNFNKVWQLSNWDCDRAKALDNLLGGCEWREMPITIMTKHDAEVEFGIRIVG